MQKSAETGGFFPSKLLSISFLPKKHSPQHFSNYLGRDNERGNSKGIKKLLSCKRYSAQHLTTKVYKADLYCHNRRHNKNKPSVF